MKNKYRIRKMWVVITVSSKRYGMIVSNREWTRDPSGQMWVLHNHYCSKVVSAKPCIVDWMDDLSDEEKDQMSVPARRFTD